MTAFKGVRVLVVEDEPLLMLDLQDTLTELGCTIVGTAARLSPAVALAAELDFDVAILDVNLGEARIDAAADIIASRAIPIVLTTGYGENVKAQVPGCVMVMKPYDSAALTAALKQVLPNV